MTSPTAAWGCGLALLGASLVLLAGPDGQARLPLSAESRTRPLQETWLRQRKLLVTGHGASAASGAPVATSPRRHPRALHEQNLDDAIIVRDADARKQEASPNRMRDMIDEIHDADPHHTAEHLEATHGEHEAVHGEPGESHEENGEHEAVHGEEGESHEVTPLMFTVAVLLASFLFANVGLLYLVNYPDEDIRSAIYNMISSSMSIFIAVTLNAGLFSFFLEQIIPSPWPRGFHIPVTHTLEFLVGLVIFIATFSFVNVFGWVWRDDETKLYACAVIGGHITAFAGITTLGTLQVQAGRSPNFMQHHHYAVVLAAWVVLVVLRTLSQATRNYFAGALVDDYSPVGQHRQPRDPNSCHPHHEDHWRAEVCEAEDEASSLILSFLINQLGIWKITGRMMPLHGEEDASLHTESEISEMACFGAGAMLLLGVSSVAAKIVPALPRLGGNAPMSFQSRLFTGFQMLCAMSMSWFALDVGFWVMQRVLHGTLLDSFAMAQVVNALGLTAASILCIIVLDRIADRWQEKSQVDGSDEEKAYEHLERAFRKVIEAFGLLVGLVWEKASDAAIEIIVEGNSHLAHHPVISKIMAFFLVSLLLFRAWLQFIVPLATKSKEQHKTAMQLDVLQRSNDLTRMAQEISDLIRKHPQLESMLPQLRFETPAAAGAVVTPGSVVVVGSHFS